MYYVYIIRSEKNGMYYKGQTNDLQRRLIEHNSGKEKYTSRYLPWILVWYSIKESRSEAILLEKKLKNITSKERIEAFIKRHPQDHIGGPDSA